jgi:hypothetical protein
MTAAAAAGAVQQKRGQYVSLMLLLLLLLQLWSALARWLPNRPHAALTPPQLQQSEL